jgi:hypothetical protein
MFGRVPRDINGKRAPRFASQGLAIFGGDHFTESMWVKHRFTLLCGTVRLGSLPAIAEIAKCIADVGLRPIAAVGRFILLCGATDLGVYGSKIGETQDGGCHIDTTASNEVGD